MRRALAEHALELAEMMGLSIADHLEQAAEAYAESMRRTARVAASIDYDAAYKAALEAVIRRTGEQD